MRRGGRWWIPGCTGRGGTEGVVVGSCWQVCCFWRVWGGGSWEEVGRLVFWRLCLVISFCHLFLSLVYVLSAHSPSVG